MVAFSRLKVDLAAFLCVFLSIGLSGCIKLCATNKYVFQGSGTFYPEKDSLKVGDTLWYSSSFPDHLTNLGTNELIDFSNAQNIVSAINVLVVTPPTSVVGGIDSFSLIPLVGKFGVNALIPHITRDVTYAEQNGTYQLSFALVARKKGIYSITAVDIEFARKKCSTAYINMPLTNNDNHSQYLQITYFPGSPYGNTIPPLALTHTYCFKVY